MLPQEMGCSSGMTYWRRLRNWLAAGVWDDLHLVLLDRLELADHIDWSQASLDSGSVPAPGGPTNRAQPNGSRPIGLEAPTGGRPWRYPIGDQAYSGKPPRFIDAGDDDWRHSRDSPTA